MGKGLLVFYGILMKHTTFRMSRKWTIFSVTANGTFMSTLSAGIVNVALPSMSAQFGVPLENIQLVVTLYLLIVTCFLPVFGKLSDMYSRKHLYLGGFAAFGVGSMLAAFAPNLTFLLGARILQALGASAMMANSQAMIAKVFHGKSRGQAFGAIGAVVAVGTLAGPAIGGILIQNFGWASVFWVAVPVSVVGIWRGIYIIPRFLAHKKVKMDLWGALFFTLMCFSFLYAVDVGMDKGWLSAQILLLFVSAGVFFYLFLYREKHVREPFMGISIFKIPAIAYGCAVALLGFMALFTNSILFPFYLSDIMLMKPIEMGLLMLPFPISLAISSPVSGILSSRFGAHILTTIGFGFMLAGALMFAFIGQSPSILYIVSTQLIMGIGSGTFQTPNNNSVISAAPKGRLGIVSSVNALARNAGMVLGIALSVAIFAAV